MNYNKLLLPLMMLMRKAKPTDQPVSNGLIKTRVWYICDISILRHDIRNVLAALTTTGPKSIWPRDDGTMNITAYEKHVARKMRLRLWMFVRHCGKSGDFGADVIARGFLFRKIVVQCKCYSGKVGVKAVQEAYTAKRFYNASRAAVATNSEFTKSARLLAKRCGVELWERY